MVPPIVPFTTLLLAAGIIAVLFFRRSGGKTTELAEGGLQIPLSASFSSLKGAGPFGGGHNNLNPLLVLHADGVEYRVIRRTTVPYADISAVDVAGPNLLLTFANSAFTFTGKTRDRQALAAALRFLRDKRCPLSANAEAAADRSPN